jgi:outer membrane lipoprotein SlyB
MSKSCLSTNLSVCLLALALVGCKSHGPGGNVIVDMKGVNRAEYQKDLNECQTYATQVDTTGKVGGNAAGGAVVGGAIGAIFGGPEGAARGAGAGAVTGGARGVEQTAGERHQVVANCLRNRGYTVLN